MNIFDVEFEFFNAGQGGHWEPLILPLEHVTESNALDDYSWPFVDWYDFSGL